MDHSIFQILICKKKRENENEFQNFVWVLPFFVAPPPPPRFYVLFTAKLSKNLINDEEDV